jgi:O-antigen/teichoic acid export membrane protein
MAEVKAVNAGRGVLFIAVAKLYFMVAGYAIYFVLPRLFGGEAGKVEWGNYLLVIALVSVIDNVIVTGTIQGVSRFTAQDESTAEAVKKRALQLQLFLGGGIAAAYALLAPWIAAWEKDPSLVDHYRLSAGIVICYSFYAVFVGAANGMRQFGKQAALDMIFATIRATLILGFAAAGWGSFGAVGGFVSAAGVILVISAIWVGPPKGAGAFPMGKLARFIGALFLYTFALNFVMRMDLFLLKRFAVDLAPAGTVNPVELASTYTAYYGTAQSLAFIPYQAILAVAFVIFPLISRSTFDQDLKATQTYIRQTLRLSFVFVTGVAVVLIANPEAMISVPYPDIYRIGGPALRYLAAGMVCFSMFTIVNTILNSAGRTRLTILAGLFTLVCTTVSNALVVPQAESLDAALQLAAYCSAGSMAAGLIFAAFLLYRSFGAAFVPLSVARTLLAGAVAAGVGHLIPEVSKLVTLAEGVLVFFVYLIVLIFLREFSSTDLANFKRVFSGRRSK